MSGGGPQNKSVNQLKMSKKKLTIEIDHVDHTTVVLTNTRTGATFTYNPLKHIGIEAFLYTPNKPEFPPLLFSNTLRDGHEWGNC